MNQKTKITLLGLVMIVTCSYGQNDWQKGYFITLEQDTIHGDVEYRSNSKNYESCVFKNAGKVEEYLPYEIYGYAMEGGKVFSSQIVDSSFVEVLVTGKISLYRGQDKYYVRKDTALLTLESNRVKEKKDGAVVLVEKGQWRGIVNYLTSDCLDNTSGKVNRLKLDEIRLTRFIVRYNQCTGLPYTEYKAEKPWTKFAFGASAGVVMTEIRVQDNVGRYGYLDDQYMSFDPSVGILLELSSPRITDRLAFQGELHFIKSSFSSLIVIDELYTDYHDLYIDLMTLSLPISLKYSFRERKYGWYLQGGMVSDFHVKSETRHLNETVNRDVVNTAPEREPFEVHDIQLGFWGGIGIIRTYEKFRGSLTLRYFRMATLNKTEQFTARNSRLSLNLILFTK